MKKDETGRDRLMDALLKEDARGGADDALLADVETAIDDSQAEPAAASGRKGSGARRALGLAAAACAAGGVVWVTNPDFFGERNDRTLAMEQAAADWAYQASPAAPSEEVLGYSGKSLAGRKAPADASAPPPAPEPRLTVDATPVTGPQPDLAKVDHDDPGASPPRVRRTGLPSKPVPVPLVQPTRSRPMDLAYNALNENDASRGYRDLLRRKESESLTRSSGPAPVPGEAGGEGGKDAGFGNADKGGFRRNAPPVDRERYGQLVDQPWKTPWKAPLSTFSVDVDTASYSNVRRLLTSGAQVPKDAVRIEELVNYFDYGYPAPVEGGPFAVHLDLATCPWAAEHHLVKIGIKGREVDTNTRPPSNLVFLIDVSGSMRSHDKLPLLVDSMKVLVEELDERDSVGIVVYAGSAGTLLPPTKVVGNGRTEILSALDSLSAGGSTAGAAGIRGAYELAARHFVKGGVNRVILATDGDFNVGVTGQGALVDLVKERARGGIFLSVLGFGTGNINDSMMEAITNDGNGNYFYIDSQREGRKVFLQDMSGTLVTIAKDVKIQVEFNPGKVAAYRLIGYANRILRDEDFNNDKIDAGDIGAGHTVTALYEIVPTGVKVPDVGGVDPLKYQKPAGQAAVDSPEWMTVKLRYKAPDGDKSTLMELPLETDPVRWKAASPDFQFAAAVALFGEKLRGSDKIGNAGWALVRKLAERGTGRDAHGHRAEFRELLDLAVQRRPDPAPPVNEPVPVPRQPDPPAAEAPQVR